MVTPTTINPTALLALALVLVAGVAAPSFGQGSETPGKPKPANPLNPLTAIDPFIGTFDGEGMTIVIRKSEEGYAGEVRKADLTFPLKAVRKGEMLAGAFEYEGEKFEFFLLITSEGVSFNTPLKLKRREATGAAPTKPVEVATPVAPPVTPTLTPPPVTPPVTPPPTLTIKEPPLVKPPAVTPPVAGTKPATPVFNFKADDGFSWAGFPKGAYVNFEDTTTEPGALPQTSQSLLWFTGLEAGKETVQPFRYTVDAWKRAGQPLVWLSRSFPLDKLGYQAGAKSTGTMQIDGADVPCDITEYSREFLRNGKSTTLRLQLWTSSRIMLPTQVLTLAGESIALPSNTTRLVTIGEDWETQGDFKLITLKQVQRIGNTELKVAVFESIDKLIAPNLALQTHTKRHVTSQVPGGISFFSVHKRNQFNQTQTSTTTAASYGVAATEAELPKP